VARYGAEYADPEKYQTARTAVYAPWVLADVARVSLVRGTEFRSKPATDDDLVSCCAAYQALSDPELGRKTPGALGHFLLRMGGQQLAFQNSYANDLSRTVALLEQTSPARTPEIATPGWPERLLGCSLREYVGTAILLYAGALKNQGRFDPGWLTQPQAEEITREIPADTLRRVIEDNYAADKDQLKAMQQAAEQKTGVPDAQYRRFGFNPLSGKPAVAIVSDGLLIPVPAYILRKASPLGIYYAGMEKWGGKFSTDLGYLFEAYVGRQLRLLPDAVVVPEIAYGSKKKAELSVDWFVIFDDCVVLVEVEIDPANRAGAPRGQRPPRCPRQGAQACRGAAEYFRVDGPQPRGRLRGHPERPSADRARGHHGAVPHRGHALHQVLPAAMRYPVPGLQCFRA
jgi:hypothetical protein